VNDDGSVKRGPQNFAFAREHGFKIISVADLIAYRQRRERLVEQTAKFDVETAIGKAKGYSYVTPFDQVEQLALVYGDIASGRQRAREAAPRERAGRRVRLARHTQQGVRGVQARGRGHSRLSAGGCGGRSRGPARRRKSGSAAQRQQSWRDVGLGAQILRDLNVSSIRLISSSNRHYVGLSGFGIEITETIKLD
jgi:3,4-dihydroxy 2-butanone 4-phosphate synthase / GTP cyclohydrolase II